MPTLKIKVGTELNLDGLKKLERRLKAAEKLEGVYGIIDDSGNPNQAPHSGGKSVHEVGVLQELGDPNNTLNGREAPIPPRPFFSTKVMEKMPEWKRQMVNKILKKLWNVSASTRFKTNLKNLTVKAGRDIKISIIQWSEPGNSPFTKKMKGFDDPLIETGKLKESAKGIVRNKK